MATNYQYYLAECEKRGKEGEQRACIREVHHVCPPDHGVYRALADHEVSTNPRLYEVWEDHLRLEHLMEYEGINEGCLGPQYCTVRL